MATVRFNATCLATYKSELSIPDEVALDETKVLAYIRENISDAPVLEVDFLSDLDDVDEMLDVDDIESIEFEEERELL